MGLPASPQPFYSSKGFWTALFALAAVGYHAWETKSFDFDLTAAAVLMVLTNVFRWTAEQPLALPGPGVRKTRPAAGSTQRLTKD